LCAPASGVSFNVVATMFSPLSASCQAPVLFWTRHIGYRGSGRFGKEFGCIAQECDFCWASAAAVQHDQIYPYQIICQRFEDAM
jgi:hypothetical protein